MRFILGDCDVFMLIEAFYHYSFSTKSSITSSLIKVFIHKLLFDKILTLVFIVKVVSI